VSQANECWEALASEDADVQPGEGFPEASRFGLVAVAPRKYSADDYKRLKLLLRMLEERIAKETPKVRSPTTPCGAHFEH
jgi:hypothetical protein